MPEQPRRRINLDRDALRVPGHWRPDHIYETKDGSIVLRKGLVLTGFREYGQSYVDRELGVRWVAWRRGSRRTGRAGTFGSWAGARKVLGSLRRVRAGGGGR